MTAYSRGSSALMDHSGDDERLEEDKVITCGSDEEFS